MGESLCIVGGGYVGLPLAVALAGSYPVTVMTRSPEHAAELASGKDRTRTFSAEELRRNPIAFTCDIRDARDATIYIVTVPTPVHTDHTPDLGPVEEATRSVASVLSPGNLVIYESTVHIGCTETFCVPLLEAGSGLKADLDFTYGFSPERINPADTEHTLRTVVKIIAGSTAEATRRMERMYGSVVHAGLHRAPSIKVAEASKLVENIQRDVNIALMNELSRLFHAFDIDTLDVLAAASTKWNFLPFRPGLVGGHCIGVDPYYLIFNGIRQGVPTPLVALSRMINNGMAAYIAEQAVTLLKRQGTDPALASALLLGITFKEDCPDIRNSQSAVIADLLDDVTARVDVYDPVADPDEVRRVYGREPLALETLLARRYDLIVISVAHAPFREIDIPSLLRRPDAPLLDLKGLLPKEVSTFRL